MSTRLKIIILITFILIVLFLYIERTTISNSITRIKKEQEIKSIRNRPFPLAGEEKFGNDAGMETGDDTNIPLLNRSPVESPP